MNTVLIIILVGIVFIDGKLWKLVLEQRRHNKAVEAILGEIRDKN